MLRKNIPALDGLRALAIGSVLLNHFWNFPSSTPIINRFAEMGWGGVDLFFVLSGFLITRILIADESKPDYFKRFYIRRAKRILPVYYLVLLVVLVGFSFVGTSAALESTRRDWWWYALFLSNVRLVQVGWQVFALDVTWSLAIEEQFYLIWPSVFRGFGKRRLAIICVCLAVALPVVRLVLLKTHTVGRPALDLLTPFRMDNLAIGAFLACVEPRLPAFGRASVVAFCAAVAAAIASIGLGDMARTSDFAIVIGHSLLALVAALIIQAAVTGTSGLARILSLAPLVRFGKVSYGMYLYHSIVAAVVAAAFTHLFGLSIAHLSSNAVLSGLLQVIFLSGCTYAAAYLSFRFYEEPILRTGTARPLGAIETRDTPPVQSTGV